MNSIIKFILNVINVLNFRWNCFVGYIHDVSAKMGVGHWTVWFYDTFTWHLSNDLRLINGMPYNEYLVRCELDTANHQVRYYSNIAYELTLDYIFSQLDEDKQSELIENSEKIHESEIKEREIINE